MGNMIKGINIFLAVYGLTLNCDPKESREFTNLNIVDKDGKVVGTVNFISKNKHEINIVSEKYGTIKGKMKTSSKVRYPHETTYAISYNISDVQSSSYDMVHGNFWVRETHRQKSDGFDIGGGINLLKDNKSIAFFSVNALKCSYGIGVNDKDLSFEKTGPNDYRFVLTNQEENNVCIMGPGDKITLSNDTEYFNRKSHPYIVENGGKPEFSFKANAPIPIKRGERAIIRIFEHVKEMQYKPSVEEMMNELRLLTKNGDSNFIDNLIALSFNDFTISTLFENIELGNFRIDKNDLDVMFAGNPKTKLGVPNIDEDGIISFNTPSKTKEKQGNV